MFQLINNPGSKLPGKTRQQPGPAVIGLSIRTSLLMGFGAMAGVMLLATLVALFSTTRVIDSIGVILDKRLPAMVQTFQVAKDADALAATGVPLAAVRTDSVRQIAFQRVDTAVAALQNSLDNLVSIATGTDDVRRLASELTRNLHRLRNMADQQIDMALEHQFKREQLLSILQTFKQNLTYRIRILEGDSVVIDRLLSRPSPSLDQVIKMMRQSARWASVPRFYTEMETITGRVLAAIQDPTLPALDVSRQILETAFNDADIIFKKLPPDINADIARPFKELREITLAETGLLALRRRELTLGIESQNLIGENNRVTRLVNRATSVMVNNKLDVMAKAGQAANETRQRYTFILLLVTGLGLLMIAALMYFHVMRHVIIRLSRLSHAMQSLAAGQLDTPLPPSGKDELGHLGFAVRQFQKTAVEAKERESDLRISNQKVEKAYVELEQKAGELSIANNKLEEISATDFLTGVANRRSFDEVLAVEWARAGRTRQSMALIMIDIDFFKKFNDRYGHQAGDKCLKKVSAALMANLYRAGDFVARYGGEEFTIISPATDLTGARKLAEKIRQSVEKLALIHEESSFGVITISMGIAVDIPDGKKLAEELISHADKALYQAKAGGRNCIKY